MRKRKVWSIFIIVAILGTFITCYVWLNRGQAVENSSPVVNTSENQASQESPKVDTSTNQVTQESPQMKKIIDSLANLLKNNYVDPDKGAKAANMLLANERDGQYEPLSGQQLSTKLTDDVRMILADKHFMVVYDPNLKNQQKKSEEELKQEFLEQARKDNFGVTKVEVLEGNIGLLKLKGFLDPRDAKEVIVDAMKKVQDTAGMIIDLRGNGGGSPEMVQLVSSYFFGETPVHLNSLYFRNAGTTTGTTKEFWTLKEIEGKRRPDVPLYILTDEMTFSAAEEFAYNMKNLKRGVILGAVTGGGANPGGFMPLSEEYVVFIPQGKAINPITGTNWEGVGVEPDQKIYSSQAFEVAYSALKSQLAEGNK